MQETVINQQQIEEVLDRITGTGAKGADLTQITRFIHQVCGISGSRAGYDAPWTRHDVKIAVEAVQKAARERGFKHWTTGQGPYAVERVARNASV